MIFHLKDAPPKMAESSGDTKAFCYEFDVTYVCGHTEVCRVWFPFGGYCKTSRQFEACALAGEEQCRKYGETNPCVSCWNNIVCSGGKTR